MQFRFLDYAAAGGFDPSPCPPSRTDCPHRSPELPKRPFARSVYSVTFRSFHGMADNRLSRLVMPIARRLPEFDKIDRFR